MGEGAKRSVDFIMQKYNGIAAKKAAEEKELERKQSKRKSKKPALKGAK